MTYTEGFYAIDELPFLKIGDRYMSDFQLVSVLYLQLSFKLSVLQISVYMQGVFQIHTIF